MRFFSLWFGVWFFVVVFGFGLVFLLLFWFEVVVFNQIKLFSAL